MSDVVLALNAGSSTIKFALFALGGANPVPRFRGLIDGVGRAPRMTVRGADGAVVDTRGWPDDPGRAAAAFADDILTWIDERLGGDRLAAFSHRFAHGGPDFAAPVLITEVVAASLQTLCDLAPLHEPHNLAMARAVAERRPDLPNVACFDTAFFHDLPATARRVPIPREWEAKGVRRYGFHGLSYAYLRRRRGEIAPGGLPRRVVFAHLGSGASLCACLDGQPVETTMGFSPLDGLVMSTRCGDLDPGVVLYLMRRGGLSLQQVEDMLYRQSGLLGVSGLSGDMRTLLASAAPEAAEAVALFVFRVVREIGALAACMGGVDALVFSAGVGEHAGDIRRRVCERLAWMGLAFDADANSDGRARISVPASAVSAWVIPTDEEIGLATGAAALLPALT